MYEKRLRSEDHSGIIAVIPIARGTELFRQDEWRVDESVGWDALSVDEVADLPLADRSRFLRYAYDIAFGTMVGTFDWARAQHVANFMNHSCHPNMIYGLDDNIIASRDIAAGEELTIDYGNFIVNLDQDFQCGCQSPHCRHIIRHDDWLQLVPSHGLHFPTFMHPAIHALNLR